MTSKTKKGRSEEFKQEEEFRAVVIADSFNIRFAPITNSMPKALLPVVNCPLIDYTLQSLYNNGVQHVIVFCSIHPQQIKQHLQCRGWLSNSRMRVEMVVSEACSSLGDALRDLDAKGVLNQDFVLLSSDIVSNVNLRSLYEAHRQRRLKLKTPVMTVLMKTAPPSHPSRCREDNNVYAIDADDGRIVDFHSFEHSRKFKLSVDLIMKCRMLQVRYDFLDTHIMICSPQVPALFSDNFDYLTRDDFLRGILNNEEILGNTIYISDIGSQYAAQVSNLAMYDAVSQNLMSRWAYPLVPDENFSCAKRPRYVLERHNVYRGSDVEVGAGSKISKSVIIGHGSSIGNNCVISQTTIGDNVHIGNNVRLQRAYVLDGCVIEDECSVTHSLLDAGVTLKSNVHVGKGCILGKQVVIGPNITLSSPQCLAVPYENAASDRALVGPEGLGTSFTMQAYCANKGLDEEIEDVVLSNMQEGWGVELGVQTSEGEEEEADEDDEESSNSGTDFSDDEVDGLDETDARPEAPAGVGFEDAGWFYQEVVGTLERGLEEKISDQHLILEINGAKSAYGIYIDEVNKLLTKAFLFLPLQKDSTLPVDVYVKQLLQTMKKLLPVLKNYIRSSESQMQCLQAIEENAVQSEKVQAGLQTLLKLMYDEDVLEEEVIIKWYNTCQVSIQSKVTRFIEWLQEAEEESDSN